MEIIWSEDAKSDYHQNIDYLISEWNENVARRFIREVENILALLETNPDLYPNTGYKQVKKAVILKQITLYYHIEGKTIYLVRFWNNYQDPNRLQL